MIDKENLPTIYEIDDITAFRLDSREKRKKEEIINASWKLGMGRLGKCCLWGTKAWLTLYQEKKNSHETYTEFYSPFAGGWYIAIANFADVHNISGVSSIKIPNKTKQNHIEIDEPKLTLITTWLMKKRNETECIPVLTYKNINEAINL